MNENEENICVRKQEIIEVAQKVFAEFGYKKVTMDDVAARMNITRSALYYYYKSKEELFVAVGEYDFRLYKSELEKVVESAKTTEDSFVAFCGSFLPMRKKFRELYKLGYDDFFFPLGTHSKLKNMVGDIHTGMIVKIFKKDRKLASIDNINYYAALLTYSIRGIVLNNYDATIEQVEHDILALCRVFCHGLPSAASAVRNDYDKKDK